MYDCNPSEPYTRFTRRNVAGGWALMLGSAICCLAPWHGASAQLSGANLIRIILPATTSSPLDVAARFLAKNLQAQTGSAVIVESRPGAGGAIATKFVAGAAPDGNTLLFASVSHVVIPLVIKDIGYDPIKDFVPVSEIATGAWVLVVSPTVPVSSLAELVAYTKANPGKLSIGFAPGTAPHLVVESFKEQTGAQITDVPYRGATPAINDILSGVVHLAFNTPNIMLPLINSGLLRALAVTGQTRDPDLPDVPTMAEAGFPKLTLYYWLGILAPGQTPTAVVSKLSADIHNSLNTPEAISAMAALGFQRKLGSSAEFSAVLARDAQAWGEIAKSAGITPN